MVVSISTGKNVGVAPGANIYYCAAESVDEGGEKQGFSTANAIDKILERNKFLPDKDKIRVISMSLGFTPKDKGYDEYMEAIERAKKEKIFVIDANTDVTYGKDCFIGGVDIEAFKDKNDINNFNSYSWDLWQMLYNNEQEREYSFNTIEEANPSKLLLLLLLLLPFTKKIVASSIGEEDYSFNAYGGISSAIPFLAGVYALACEVYPKITPEEFWKVALETEHATTLTNYPVDAEGIIIQRYELIHKLKEKK